MKKPRIYAGVTPHDLNRNKKLSCADCEATTDKLFTDHRDPPLEEHKCLCADCAKSHIDDQISNLESQIDDLKIAKTLIRS